MSALNLFPAPSPRKKMPPSSLSLPRAEVLALPVLCFQTTVKSAGQGSESQDEGGLLKTLVWKQL